MKYSRFLSMCALLALGAILMGAASSAGGLGRESRPRVVLTGSVVVSVDRQNGTPNPLRYKVVEVDGPWLYVQLLKKRAKATRGEPFWVNIQDIGAFMVEG